jgi:hypothetical protein
VALCPKQNFGIVVLVNAAPTGVPEGLQLDFFDLVLLGKVTPPEGHADWLDFTEERFREMTQENQFADSTDFTEPASDPQPPSLPLDRYAGAYVNRVYGDLKIELKEGAGIVMTLGPKAVQFPLTHYRANTFFFTTQGEMQTGLSGATFQSAAGGALSVTLNAYDKDGLGVFVRKP